MQTALSSPMQPRRTRAEDRWHVPSVEHLLDRARAEDRVPIARQIVEIPNGYGGFQHHLGRHPQPFTFAWADRDEELEWLAQGVALRAPAVAAGRPQDLVSAVVEPRHGAELPLWVGGSAFRIGVLPGGLWSGWPSSAFWVPRFLLVARAGRRWLVNHARVDVDDPVGAVRDRLRQERHRAEAWLRQRPQPAQPAPAILPPAPDESRIAWSARVEAAVEAIRAGQAAKLVLARAADVDGEVHVGATLAALRAAHAQAFSFAVRPDAPSTFVGATPELLVRRRDGRLSSEALAGTIAAGRDEADRKRAAQRLLDSNKDRHEHALVVEHVVGTLERLGISVAHAEAPQVVAAGRVLHLRTRAEAKGPAGPSLLDVVRALHPTPAVAGLPAPAALELLRDEPLERGWYAAPVGWLDARGDGVFAVALRSALVHDEGARLFAGAGIVEGSEPAAEWRETELKLRAMREALRFERSEVAA